jgi:arylsulfatase A-like enzyme
MHGHDLLPLLKAPETAEIRPCLYTHTGQSYGSDVAKVLRENPDLAVHSGVPWYLALNDGRWKYIRYLRHGETEELYDLQEDPEELRNLADTPEHRERLETLRAHLLTEARRTHAAFAEEIPPSRQMLKAQ